MFILLLVQHNVCVLIKFIKLTFLLLLVSKWSLTHLSLVCFDSIVCLSAALHYARIDVNNFNFIFLSAYDINVIALLGTYRLL